MRRAPRSLLAVALLLGSCSSAPSPPPSGAEGTPPTASSSTGALPTGSPANAPDLHHDAATPFVTFEELEAGPKPANAASISVSPTENAAQRTVMPISGGVLEATGSDGTTYRLIVPDGALLEDTEITMTPIQGASVIDAGGPAAPWEAARGVHLEPAGLHLFALAELRIDPAGEPDLTSWRAVTARSDGSDAHRVTSKTDGHAVVIEILHFSHDLASEDLEIPPLLDESTPVGELAQLEYEIASASRDGIDEAEAAEIYDTYKARADAALALAVGDCATAESGELGRAIGLIRTLNATGLAPDSDVFAVQEGILAAIDTCRHELRSGCYNPQIPALARRLLAMGRMAQLAGASQQEYEELMAELSDHADVGPGLPDAYRVAVTQSYSAAHEATIATDAQRGTDQLTGEIFAVGRGRYCGRLVATSTGQQVGNSGVMTRPFVGDQRCQTTWDGTQTVDVVGVVMDAGQIPGFMAPGTAGRGEHHIALYIVRPLGDVVWRDRDDECTRGASEALNFTYSGPELEGSALGGVVPRLPPDEAGASVTDRFSYDGPSLFGTAKWDDEYVLTAVEPSDVQIPPITRAIAASSGAIRGTYSAHVGSGAHAGTYRGEFDGSYDDTSSSDCSIGPFDELSFSMFDEALEPSSLSVIVWDPNTQSTERFEVTITFGDGAELADTLYVAPEYGMGSGAADAALGGENAELRIEAVTDDGVEIEIDVSCPDVS